MRNDPPFGAFTQGILTLVPVQLLATIHESWLASPYLAFVEQAPRRAVPGSQG
jgi:hypothetical protein